MATTGFTLPPLPTRLKNFKFPNLTAATQVQQLRNTGDKSKHLQAEALEQHDQRLDSLVDGLQQVINFLSGATNVAGAMTPWYPILTPAAGMTFTGVTSNSAYLRLGTLVFIRLSVSYTVGGTPHDNFRVSLPIDGIADATGSQIVPIWLGAATLAQAYVGFVVINYLQIGNPAGNLPAGANTIVANGFYEALRPAG